MGGSKVEAPKPSKEEIALQKEQLSIIKEQRAENALMKPFVLAAMRLVDDGSGGLRQMTETEYVTTLTPTELQSYQNLKLQLERQEKALKGELPLSEGMIQQKQREFEVLKENMARGGNRLVGDTPESAFSTSTSGIQALSEFNKKWGLVEDAERRGELTAGQATINQTMGVASDIGAKNYNEKIGFPQRSSGTAGLISNALVPYQQQRQMEMQAQIYNSQQQAGLLQGIGQVVGMLGGAGIMKYSDPKMKKNIKKKTGKEETRALKDVKESKSYSYRYKGEPESSKKRIGLMADEAPESIVSPDRKMISVDKQMGLLTMATKTLAKKVEQLERRKK